MMRTRLSIRPYLIRRNNFRKVNHKRRRVAGVGAASISQEKIMEYLIVIAVFGAMALYTWIIARCLRGA